MAFKSKDKNKAKYFIRSTTTLGKKMIEFCDNKVQVSSYLTKIAGENRTEVTVWQRAADLLPKTVKARKVKPATKG